MTIYRDDPAVGQSVALLNIEPDEASYRVRSIMTVGSLVLYYSLPSHVELPVGAFVEFGGVRYTLRQPEAFVMRHSRRYEYTVTFMAPEYGATIWMMTNPIDHRLSFDLTATPREQLQIIVDNMNMRDSGWTVGDCIEDTEKLVTYDYTYLFDALKALADTFHTEFVVENKRVSLKMVECHKSDPLALCYGKGNGFRSGVVRSNEDAMPPVDRLMVQGGERNINYDTYGTWMPSLDPQGKEQLMHSRQLLLPRGVQYRYDGQHFEDEDGFNTAMARVYVTDPYGRYVDRVSGRRTGTEAPYDATAYYPRRVGTVTGVTVTQDNEGNSLYDILDSTIPESLDYADNSIPGETMQVVFQTGELAGREFDVAEDGYIHLTRTFRLVSQEYDGMMMPNGDGFTPAEGDKYIVVGCTLPDAYIRDDSTRTGAEWDMLRAAIRYRYPREEYLYTFSGDIDEIWAHNNWDSIGYRFSLGEYVRLLDSRIGTDVLLRMVTIKDHLHRPWKMELTLSNAPVRTDFVDEIRSISSRTTLAGRRLARLSRASVPQGIQTRFRFVDISSDPMAEVVPEVNMYFGDMGGQTTYNIRIDGGTVQHNATTLIDAMQLRLVGSTEPSQSLNNLYPVVALDERITARASDTLYLYAKIRTDHSPGEYTAVADKHAYNSGDGFLWLYMGEISPARNGIRTFTRRWRWLVVKTPSDVVLTADISGNATNVADALNSINEGVVGNAEAIVAGNNSIRGMITALNLTIERANDLTTLLTERLSSAIAAFNSAQGGNGPHIDFDTCITAGAGNIGTAGQSSQCKVFPSIAQIDNT